MIAGSAQAGGGGGVRKIESEVECHFRHTNNGATGVHETFTGQVVKNLVNNTITLIEETVQVNGEDHELTVYLDKDISHLAISYKALNSDLLVIADGTLLKSKDSVVSAYNRQSGQVIGISCEFK